MARNATVQENEPELKKNASAGEDEMPDPGKPIEQGGGAADTGGGAQVGTGGGAAGGTEEP